MFTVLQKSPNNEHVCILTAAKWGLLEKQYLSWSNWTCDDDDDKVMQTIFYWIQENGWHYGAILIDRSSQPFNVIVGA